MNFKLLTRNSSSRHNRGGGGQERQPQRTAYQDYIEANLDDYAWAYFLANRFLSQSMDELSRWGRELLTFFEKEPEPLTRREVRERLKWPDKRTRDALDELVEMEFLKVQRGSHNLFTYERADIDSTPNPIRRLLTPEELAERWKREADA